MSKSIQEFIDSVFSQNGSLGKVLKDYELREEQRLMALQILEAYHHENIALIEAGTGVGKSWAYLIPAIYWATTRGEQTVVSTHTIPLQEQITEKDIPFLLKTLNVDIKAVLVKGMGNYLCLKKLFESRSDALMLLKEERECLSHLEDWVQFEENGSYSDVPFPLAQPLWDRVAADRSSCTSMQCPHYKECFFFKARKKMTDAHILIVNHHLLMAEISSKVLSRTKDEKSLLPKFYRLVVDEAHHLDEIALESFARKNDRIDLIRWLGRIFSDHQPEKSRSALLLKEIKSQNIQNQSLELSLQVDIPGEKRHLVTLIEELFKRIEFFCQTVLKNDKTMDTKELRWRLKAEHFLSDYWQENLKSLFIEVADLLVSMAMKLGALRSQLTEYGKEVMEKFSLHLQDLEFVAQTLSQKGEDLRAFTLDENDVSRVRWVEMTGFVSNIMLVDAHLNVAEYLRQYLFEPRVSSVLCSATLTSSSKFDYVKDRIGLSGKKWSASLSEKIYPSPFDYQNRVLLAVPKDIPFPNEFGFIKEVANAICKAVSISKGSCFILFTSYEMLKQVYHLVEDRLRDYPLLRQGDASRQVLIDRFKAKEGNVLFATDSFWEGVDVPGEALRCVIIVKLPFKVPSDPIYQAFSELYEKNGRDPFSGYSLPAASIKFKQGFGRLIRKQGDRGCILCLDRRIMEKGYGATFIKSLPDCKRSYETSTVLFEKIRKFFDDTKIM